MEALTSARTSAGKACSIHWAVAQLTAASALDMPKSRVARAPPRRECRRPRVSAPERLHAEAGIRTGDSLIAGRARTAAPLDREA